MIKDKIELGLCLGLTFTIIGGMFTFVGVHHAKTKQEAKAYEDSYTIIQELSEKIEDITEIDDIFEFVEFANETKSAVAELTKNYSSCEKERVEEKLQETIADGLNLVINIAANNTCESADYMKKEVLSETQYLKDGTTTEISTSVAHDGFSCEYNEILTGKFSGYKRISKTSASSNTESHKLVTSDKGYCGQTLNHIRNKNHLKFTSYFVSTISSGVSKVYSISTSKEDGLLTITTSDNDQDHASTYTVCISQDNCLLSENYKNSNGSLSFTYSSILENEYNQIKNKILEQYSELESINQQQ